MSASRGEDLSPLPIRSVTLPRSTTFHDDAVTTKVLPTAASQYPLDTNGFRPYRSLSFPLRSLVKPAAASAAPSIRPSTTGGAPRTTVMSNGING